MALKTGFVQRNSGLCLVNCCGYCTGVSTYGWKILIVCDCNGPCSKSDPCSFCGPKGQEVVKILARTVIKGNTVYWKGWVYEERWRIRYTLVTMELAVFKKGSAAKPVYCVADLNAKPVYCVADFNAKPVYCVADLNAKPVYCVADLNAITVNFCHQHPFTFLCGGF